MDARPGVSDLPPDADALKWEPGTVKVVSTGSTTADGKSYEGLKVTSADLEILLLLDTSHRLIRLEVPEAKVSVIRE